MLKLESGEEELLDSRRDSDSILTSVSHLLVDGTGVSFQVVEVPDGEVVSFDSFKTAVERVKPSVIFVCHGESSTGIAQPLEGLGKIAHDNVRE